jgi:hypothetical protein
MRLQFRNKKRRIERQQQAIERRAAYDALTIDQKIALTINRPGASHHEFAGLFGEIKA